MKHCSRCETDKADTDFYKSYPNPSICKECYKPDNRRRYAKNSKKVLERMRFLRSGWTPEAFEKAIATQESKCASCSTPLTFDKTGRSRACADHDHTTNTPRGVLCSACNLIIGMARDDVDLLLKCITYLRSYA